jgi:hypothetical protein
VNLQTLAAQIGSLRTRLDLLVSGIDQNNILRKPGNQTVSSVSPSWTTFTELSQPVANGTKVKFKFALTYISQGSVGIPRFQLTGPAFTLGQAVFIAWQHATAPVVRFNAASGFGGSEAAQPNVNATSFLVTYEGVVNWQGDGTLAISATTNVGTDSTFIVQGASWSECQVI